MDLDGKCEVTKILSKLSKYCIMSAVLEEVLELGKEKTTLATSAPQTEPLTTKTSDFLL